MSPWEEIKYYQYPSTFNTTVVFTGSPITSISTYEPMRVVQLLSTPSASPAGVTIGPGHGGVPSGTHLSGVSMTQTNPFLFVIALHGFLAQIDWAAQNTGSANVNCCALSLILKEWPNEDKPSKWAKLAELLGLKRQDNLEPSLSGTSLCSLLHAPLLTSIVKPAIRFWSRSKSRSALHKLALTAASLPTTYWQNLNVSNLWPAR